MYISQVHFYHTVNCSRFCFWCHQSVVCFVCVWSISGEGTTEWVCTKFAHKTFGPSLGRVWRSSSQGTKNGIFRSFQWPRSLCLVKKHYYLLVVFYFTCHVITAQVTHTKQLKIVKINFSCLSGITNLRCSNKYQFFFLRWTILHQFHKHLRRHFAYMPI